MVKTLAKKFKIVIEQKFGPYSTNSEVVAAKKRIKSKVPKGTFGTTLRTKTGYVIVHKMSYLKSLDVPATAVKQHLQAQIPSAKISVSKA